MDIGGGGEGWTDSALEPRSDEIPASMDSQMTADLPRNREAEVGSESLPANRQSKVSWKTKGLFDGGLRDPTWQDGPFIGCRSRRDSL